MALHPNTKALIEENENKFQSLNPEVEQRFRQSHLDRQINDLSRGIIPSGYDINEQVIEVANDKRNYSRFFGNIYDPTVDLEDAAAYRQSGAERLAYAIPRIGAKVASQLAQMPGTLVGAAAWATTGFDPEKVKLAVNNKWQQAIQGMEEDVKAKLPVYTANAVKEGNLWDNVFSTAFWANEGADGVGFLLSFLAPGMAVRGLQAGTKLAKVVGRTQKFADVTDDVLATSLNTLFESFAEGGETYRDMLDELGDPAKAGEAAVSNMKKNFGILLASNALEQKWLFNGFSKWGKGVDKATERVKKSVLGRMINPETGHFLDAVTPLTRADKAGRVIGNIAKNFVREGFWEEGMQYAAGQASKEDIGKELDFFQTIESTLNSYIEGLSETDMHKSILLGGVLGSLSGGFQTMQESAAEDRLLEGQTARKATFLERAIGRKDLKDSKGLSTLLRENYINRYDTLKSLAKLDKDENPIIENGQYVIDPDKVNDSAKSLLSRQAIKEFMIMAGKNNNKEAYEYLKNKLDLNYMMPFFQVNGGLDLLKTHIKALAETDSEMMTKEGLIIGNEEIQQDLLEKAERYQNIYSKILNTNDFNVNISYDTKNDKALFANFKDSIASQKMMGEAEVSFFNKRINAITSELASYNTDAGGVSLTSNATNPEAIITDLEKQVNDNKDKLSPTDTNYLFKQIDHLKSHYEKMEVAKTDLKSLYDKTFLQKLYDTKVGERDAAVEADKAIKDNKVKDDNSVSLSDPLKALYNDAVEIEDIDYQGKPYKAQHSGEIALKFKDDNGVTLTHKVKIGEVKPHHTSLTVHSISEEVSEMDKDGNIQIKKEDSSGRIGNKITENNTYLFKGKEYAIEDIKVVKTAKEVQEETRQKALIKTVEEGIALYKGNIERNKTNIQKGLDQLDVLNSAMAELQIKEAESLEKIGTILTTKGTSRVQKVKLLRNHGKLVKPMFLSLKEIKEEVNNVTNAIESLKNDLTEYEKSIEFLESEKERILYTTSDNYHQSFEDLISIIKDVNEGLVKDIATAEEAVAEQDRYINKLNNVLSGYFTTAANILNIEAQVEAIRNNAELSPEEISNTISDLITSVISEKTLPEDNKIMVRLGAGKMVTKKHWPALREMLDKTDYDAITKLGILPENIENLRNKIAEANRIKTELETNIELINIKGDNLTLQFENTKRIIKRFDSLYSKMLKDMGIITMDFAKVKDVSDINEEAIKESFDDPNSLITFEKDAAHPFQGSFESFLYSQGNQDFAAEIPEQLRWNVFINNFAFAGISKGESKYILRSLSFDQVSELSNESELRNQVKFFDGLDDNGIPQYLTYDAVIAKYGKDIPEQTRNDIKMVVYNRADGSLTKTTKNGAMGAQDTKNNILYTSFAKDQSVENIDNQYNKVSLRQFMMSYLEDTYGKKKYTKEQEVEAKIYAEKKLAEAVADYNSFRQDMLKKSFVFNINRIAPGVKQTEDLKDVDVTEALQTKRVDNIMLVVASSKDKKSPTVSINVSGMPFEARNGYTYVYTDNRIEPVKPKTLSDTNDVENIFNLFTNLLLNKEDSNAIETYLRNVLYFDYRKDSPYRLLVERLRIGDNEAPGAKTIIYGNNEIRYEDLNNEAKVEDFKRYLADKLWRINKKILNDKTFIEYKATPTKKGVKVVTKEWTPTKGGYKGFLMSNTQNTSKVTISVKKLAKQTMQEKAIDPRYKNQTLQLGAPAEAINKLVTRKKATKAQAPVAPKDKAPKTKGQEVADKKGYGLSSIGESPIERAETSSKEKKTADKRGYGLSPITDGVTNPKPPAAEPTDSDRTADKRGYGLRPVEDNRTPDSSIPPVDRSELTNLFGPKKGTTETPTASTTPTPPTTGASIGVAEMFGKKAPTTEDTSSETPPTDIQDDTNIDDLNRRASQIEAYELEDIDAKMEWFKQRFPDFPIHVIEGLVDNQSWGKLSKSGKVLISDIAAEGTIYHEAFHVFTQVFLTTDQKNDLYKETRKVLKDKGLTDTQVEETLAEEFRMFMMAPDGYNFYKSEAVKRNIFQKLLNWILSMFGINTINEYDINSVFNKLSDATYHIKDAKSTLKTDFDRVADLSERDTLMYIQDINFEFFQLLFGPTISENALFDLDSSIEELYKKLYEGYKANYNKKDAYKKIVDNWDTLMREHVRFIKQYKINIDKETINTFTFQNPDTAETLAINEENPTKDRREGTESYQINVSELIPSPIRLLIAGLPMLEGRRVKLSNYATRSTVVFSSIINILNNQLSDISTLEGMVNKLRILSETYPEIEILLRRLQLESNKPVSKKIFNLQNAFFVAFSNNKNNPRILSEQPNGERYFHNAVTDNFAKVLQTEWQNNVHNDVREKASGNKDVKTLFHLDKNNRVLFNPEDFINIYNNLKKLEKASTSSEGRIKYRDRLFEVMDAMGMRIAPSASNIMNVEPIQTYLNRLHEAVSVLDPKVQKSITLDDFYDGEALPIQKEFGELLQYSTNFFVNDTDLMFYNQDGNPEYSVALNSHLSKTVHALNDITDINDELVIPEYLQHLKPYDGQIGNLFAMNSRLWEYVTNGGKVELGINKGFIDLRKRGSELENSKPGDLKRVSFNSLLEGWIPFLQLADRKVGYTIKMGTPTKNVTQESFRNMMINYLRDELITSFAYFQDPVNFGGNLLNYKDNIKSLRAFEYLFDPKYVGKRLRNKPQELEDFYNSVITEEDKGNTDLATLNKLVDKYISKFNSSINRITDAYIEDMVATTQASLMEDKIINYETSLIAQGFSTPGISDSMLASYGINMDKPRLLNESDIKGLIRAALYNQYIGVTEQLKMFFGDLAMFKNKEDFHKRTTGAASTKYDTRDDVFTREHLDEHYPRVDGKSAVNSGGNFSKVVFDDVITKNNKLAKIYKDYKEINGVDAQSWATLDFYRELLIRSGRWDDPQEETYQYEMQTLALRLMRLQSEGKKLPFTISEDAFTTGVFAEHTEGKVPTKPMFKGKEIVIPELAVLPILKPQGFGHIDNVNGLYATQFFKTSTAPIFPSALADDSEMFNKVLTMMSNQNDIFTFKSAEKSTILLNEGSLNDINKEGWVNQDMRYLDFGIQLDVHDEEQGRVTASTQRTGLEMLDLFEFGAPTKVGKKLKKDTDAYQSLLKDIIKNNRNKLINELGLSINEDTGRYSFKDQKEKDQFEKVLMRTFEARLLPKSISESLELALQKDIPYLDMIINSNKIDEILMSFVSNNIIGRKVHGEMLIQESSLLYDNPSEVVKGNNLLNFYRKEAGRTFAMETMISLPKAWYPWVESIGGLEALNEAIRTTDVNLLGEDFFKLLNIPSNRIPSQGLNSLERMRVVKFFPHYHGAKVVLPYEITTKSGSDFDVDKLTSYFNSFKLDKETGKPIYLEYQDNVDNVDAIQNEINNIINRMLMEGDRFNDLIRPNNSNTLKALSEKSKDSRELSLMEQRLEGSTLPDVLSWWYNIEKGVQFWTSKSGIALAAIQNVAHSLEQNHPLELTENIQLFFEGFDSLEGYRTGVIEDAEGHKVSDNFSEFLTSFVDAAKDPFIFELVDLNTFKAFAALNRITTKDGTKSVSIESIASLFSQDIVKEYLHILQQNGGYHVSENQYNEPRYRPFFGKKKWTTVNRVTKENAYTQAIVNIAKRNNIDIAKIKAIKDKPLTFDKSLASLIQKLKKAKGDDIEILEKAISNLTKKYGYKYFSDGELDSKKVRENINDQIQVLDNFLSYMELGDSISEANKYLRKYARSNFPKHKLGLISSNEVSSGVNNIIEKGSIYTAEQDSYLSEYSKTYNETQRMYNQFSFLESDPVIAEYIEEGIIPYLSELIPNKVEFDKALNIFKSHLMVFMGMYEVRKNVKDMQDIYKYLFTGEHSMAKQLLNYKKYDTRENEAIKEFHPVIGKKIHRTRTISPIDNISKFGKRHHVHQADLIEADFYSLWNNGTDLDNRFASELILHSFIQSGLTNSSISYFNFIPPRLFDNFATETLENFSKLEEVEKRELVNIFDKQFFMNQAKNKSIVPRHNIVNKGLPKLIEDKKGYYENTNYVSQSFYMAEPNSYWDRGMKPPIGIALLKRESSESNKFTLIGMLGDGTNMIEYYPISDINDLATGISIIPSNNYAKQDFSEYDKFDTRGREERENVEYRGLSPVSEVDDVNAALSEMKPSQKRYSFFPTDSREDNNLGENKYNQFLSEETNIKKVLSLIERHSDSEYLSTMANVLRNELKYVHKVKIGEMGKGILGTFTFDNDVSKGTIDINNSIKTEAFEITAIHEALHAHLTYEYATDKAFKYSIDEILNLIRNSEAYSMIAEDYNLVSGDELIATTMSDPNLQRILGNITVKEAGEQLTALGKLWEALLRKLSQIFGGTPIETEESLLQNIMNITVDKMDSDINVGILTDQQLTVFNNSLSRDIINPIDVAPTDIKLNDYITFIGSHESLEGTLNDFSVEIPNYGTEVFSVPKGSSIDIIKEFANDIINKNMGARNDMVKQENKKELGKENVDIYINKTSNFVSDLTNINSLNLEEQNIFNNFEDLFPDFSYFDTVEKISFIKNLSEGNIELICGI